MVRNDALAVFAVRRKHAVVADQMRAGRWYQSGDSLEKLSSVTSAASGVRREQSAALDKGSGRLGLRRFGAVKAADEHSSERVVRVSRRPTRRQRPPRGAKILRRRSASREAILSLVQLFPIGFAGTD